jgi:hypothetical protein
LEKGEKNKKEEMKSVCRCWKEKVVGRGGELEEVWRGWVCR